MATNDRASPARRSVNLSTYGLTEKPMKILATSLAAAGVLLSASAFASERYSEETALCASAIATETGRSLDDANVTLKKMRDRQNLGIENTSRSNCDHESKNLLNVPRGIPRNDNII